MNVCDESTNQLVYQTEIGDCRMAEITLSHVDFAELCSQLLSKGVSVRFTAHGSSMSPFIRDGDVMTIQPLNCTMLKVGDIVFYHINDEKVVAHRVVGHHTCKGNIAIKTRGDASIGYAEQIHAGQVLGRVVSIQRGKKVIELDNTLMRAIGLLWISFSPFGPLLMRFALGVRTVILLRFYQMRRSKT